ncbi:hypothetical protein [Virgibacillus sp. Bac330]|uniref:hypothetical protein n=1 Tax=Virgibacillus sp. Bac330 TaxID=2419841 RepID=UPI0013CE7B93|nr:hypothetical protein [Virgibacillus sp. Bac330]
MATRILFVENARSVVYLNEEFNQEYEGLKDNYFTLRLHLLNYSCTKSERDLDIIIQKINTVETMEVNLL